jgi:uncharacterized protein YegP (UPF0339 family)
MPYEIKKDKSGQFRFNLKAGNGQIVLSSEAYKQKESALAGINAVRACGPDDTNFERKESTSKQPYFTLKARNGETLGRSEMYVSASSRDKGIASVQKNSASLKVNDLA